MILIDLAAYANDTLAQMEEIQAMNSFYHLHEYDHKDNMSINHRGPRDHSRLSRRRHFGYTAGAGGNGIHDHAHEQHADHPDHAITSEHDPAQDESQAADPPVSSELTYSGREMDVYQVLVAVERGEITAQDAARKLEELEELEELGEPAEGSSEHRLI